MERTNADRTNQFDDPSPPVQHPEAVISDDIVRIFRPEQPGAPALIKPVGDAQPTSQSIPASILRQIDGESGYFRARLVAGAWVIGDALPDQRWE